MKLEMAESMRAPIRFHLRRPGHHEALCCAQVVPTSVPVDNWGCAWISEQRCKSCERIREEMQARAAVYIELDENTD